MHLDKLNYDSHTCSVCQLISYATYVFLCSLHTASPRKQALLDLTQGRTGLRPMALPSLIPPSTSVQQT